MELGELARPLKVRLGLSWPLHHPVAALARTYRRPSLRVQLRGRHPHLANAEQGCFSSYGVWKVAISAKRRDFAPPYSSNMRHAASAGNWGT